MFQTILKPVLLVLALIVFSVPAMADGKEGRYKFSTLDPVLLKLVLLALKEQGVEGNKEMALGITTDDCPSDCNDSVGGGFCYCDKENGKCPGGTTETGGDNPGKECKVNPKSGIVGGGGLPEPLQVLMP